MVSFVLQITIPADRQIETSHWSARAPLPPRLALELLEYLQTWCVDVEETRRGSMTVFTNIAIATNLVRSWLRIGLEDDNILIGRS